MALAESINPDTEVEWALINDMTYADVPRKIVSDTGGGMGGLMCFSAQSLSSEDDLRRGLQLIDDLMDPDCHNLMVNGIEGTHYEVDDSGAITIIDQPLWEQQVQPYSGSIPTNNDTPLYRSTDEMVNLANELIAENDDYAVVNIAQPLTSATYDSSWDVRSEEHTSELQSRGHLVCRLLLEKKKRSAGYE